MTSLRSNSSSVEISYCMSPREETQPEGTTHTRALALSRAGPLYSRAGMAFGLSETRECFKLFAMYSLGVGRNQVPCETKTNPTRPVGRINIEQDKRLELITVLSPPLAFLIILRHQASYRWNHIVFNDTGSLLAVHIPARDETHTGNYVVFSAHLRCSILSRENIVCD